MVKFLDLQSQYQLIKTEIDEAIATVISESAYIGGKYVKKFEEEFSQYCNTAYCIGVANGTDALEIAIEALDLPKGSEIIVPANSFIASSEAVTRTGHRVIFADVTPDSYILDVSDVAKRITKKTSAIVAVHLYGHPCDMDPLKELASIHGLKIIEDCAQAHGAEYKGKRVGSLGDIATFSFYPGKNLGAYGDAGAITTNNAELAEKSRMIANHGRIAKYDHEFEGRNSRLDGLQAAILSVKLKHLDAWTGKRIAAANDYLENMKEIGEIILPVRQEWAKQVYHLFVVRCVNRNELAEYLKEHGVQTGVHYPVALPKLKAYSYLGQSEDRLFANESDGMLLSLPIGEHLSQEDTLKVVKLIKKYFDV
ncbi:DegT/DnrJ/EryC1/StrS family aminotransferase [Thalassolituus hydrocarboniclasticus]|uniref:DegT/DnrJ/EryC1/StrS family aminotransferase n=1 Tax=Thalassolituus hydrocarboniclasticus TaxID=2742796 RepID=A0ABY6AB81_9GAMM|nr:DegT/DnrJ/EryC1/StrS family aminotransferase [Thalassolituus hydrocarboniclasticus]UXD87957.1 DegT/DnrJ/EryC1/StrS family aminotransferase [Thalassolituus hydrocarboniclasticus]